MAKEESLSSEGSKRQTANRSNSSFSCGPKTAKGKSTSSQNAQKFGFFSKKILLPGESWDDFRSFSERLYGQLVPRNPMEEHIVEKYIVVEWRLKRLPEIEVGIFDRYGISVQGNQCGAAFALVNSVQTDNILNQLARYEATLYRQSLKYLDVLRALRKDGFGGGGATVVEASVVDIIPAGEADNTTQSRPVSKDQQTCSTSDPSGAARSELP